MKRFVISIIVLSIGLFILSQVFAADVNDRSKSEPPSRSAKSGRISKAPGGEGENSLIGDLEFLADPNAVKTKLKKYKGLEQELDKVTKASAKEMREWGQGLVEERMDLAEAVNKQTVAELVFVRQVAVEEGALKTAAAIDGLLLDRQDRFEKVSKKIEMAMRRSDRLERGTVRGSRRDLRGRYRGRGQDMYEEPTYRNGARDTYRDRSRIRDRELEERDMERRSP
ncbi:MAG TPA: hypothetical protein VMX13_05655 [Sedimentisphaerales bacterium]|nr:hypothetical protein [Sedimentisphaerales bacterium]